MFFEINFHFFIIKWTKIIKLRIALKLAKERDEMFGRDHPLDPVRERVKHFSARLLK